MSAPCPHVTEPADPAAGEGGALAAEVRREQQHVERAYARVEELRAVVAAREIASQRDALDGDERAIYERDVTVLQAARRRADLDTAGEGLVFGRLDLAGRQVLHIGRLGVRTDAQEPLVVDWRAPAAGAFYQATAAAPQGVVRRRTISCRGPRVLGVDDDLLDPAAVDALEGAVVVGDGAFLAAVSRERTEHMRDIVATIQAEQDAAVRAPDDGALVVTGGPGTGKTAVALHRVAYLMYARRELYGRRGVLVVGPSPVFLDYIGQVLPSLGETSVRLVSLGGLAPVPAAVSVGGYDAPAVAAIKGSARMAELLVRLIRQLAQPRDVDDLVLSRWGATLTVPATDLTKRRSAALRSTRSHNASRQQVAQGVADAAWRAWQRRPQATRIEADDHREFLSWLRSEPPYQRAVQRLWPVLEPWAVFGALRRGALPLERLARGLLHDEEVAALSLAWAQAEAADPRSVSAADAALLDELQELLGPPPAAEPDDEDEDDDAPEPGYGEVSTIGDSLARTRRDPTEDEDYRGFAHIVVDEAQDVSPMQWRSLARRGRSATWTVVGDWAQSAWPDLAEVQRALALALSRGRRREVALSTNYRSSTEIAVLAARLLHRIDPTAVPPEAVRATGIEPLLLDGPDPLALLPAAVQRLLDDVTGTVGVICPHAALAAVRRRLEGLLAAHPRLSVLDAWAVKGLEFDGCVVALPRDLAAEGLTPTAGLRSLYVCLTRATQRLTVAGALPELD